MEILLWQDGNFKKAPKDTEIEVSGYIGCDYATNNPIHVPPGTKAKVLSRRGKNTLSGKAVTASTLIELQGENLPEVYAV